MKPRCKQPPDDCSPITSFEVDFGTPVFLSQDDNRQLAEAIEKIVKKPYNQPVDGVHWVSGFGSKPQFSVADAALLGRAPAPESTRPADGEEPTFDDSVYHITTTARSFVSEKEKQRTLRERGEGHRR